MLNDYYQNIGLKGFFKRYGFVNALKRGLFTANRFHYVSDYEHRKVLWQAKVKNETSEYLKYESVDPEGLAFADVKLNNPIWLFWDTGIENAPAIVKKCYESMVMYYGDRVLCLNNDNLSQYITMPVYVEEKLSLGIMPKAIYTDLMRFALLENYGGTWIDSTVFLTGEIPREILNSEFFAFRNSLGLLENPALFPVWFIHSKPHGSIIKRTRNVVFAYWKNEQHLCEYLLSNILMTAVINEDTVESERIPYLNSDYSERLIRIIGEEYSREKADWIKKLTSIHKLTYKLSENVGRKNSIYNSIMEDYF